MADQFAGPTKKRRHPVYQAPTRPRLYDPDATDVAGILHIVPDGDVILAPGNGSFPRLFSVRAEAMARSPVFKAMLLGGFSEASKVSKVNPGTVPLPDDDCEAIKILARILHQETDSLPLEFDPRQYTDILQAFAYAVHKYDCANLVKPWGRFWIAAHIDDIRRDVQSGDSQYATNTAEAWLYIAYALDLWEEFYQISILFISDSFLHVNPFWVNWNPDARKNDRYDGLVPDGVMRSILSEKKRWIDFLCSRIHLAVNHIGKGLHDHLKNNQTCKVQESNLATISAILIRQRYFSVDLPQTNLRYYVDIIQEISSTNYKVKISECTSNAGEPTSKKVCKDCVALVEEVAKLYSLARSVRGQCLDCLKNGDYHYEARKCRLSIQGADKYGFAWKNGDVVGSWPSMMDTLVPNDSTGAW